MLPLTLATYASLVFLALRAPAPATRERFQSRPQQLSPEQRVGRLPHTETRRRAQAALEAHGRVLVAVEGMDEAERETLSEVVVSLYQAAGLLLDVAEARERIAKEVAALRERGPHSSEEAGEESHTSRLTQLEEGMRSADAELSGAPDRLRASRKEVVRISIESGDGAADARAAELARSLDAWSLRLDALVHKLSSTDKQ